MDGLGLGDDQESVDMGDRRGVVPAGAGVGLDQVHQEISRKEDFRLFLQIEEIAAHPFGPRVSALDARAGEILQAEYEVARLVDPRDRSNRLWRYHDHAVALVPLEIAGLEH